MREGRGREGEERDRKTETHREAYEIPSEN